MELKDLLREDIEREHQYLSEQKVGSDEYNDSLKRLTTLEEKLFDLEKFESESAQNDMRMKDEKKDRLIKNVLESIKIGSGIVVPLIGLVWITATEKEVTFCGALKEYTRLFIPKKTV